MLASRILSVKPRDKLLATLWGGLTLNTDPSNLLWKDASPQMIAIIDQVELAFVVEGAKFRLGEMPFDKASLSHYELCQRYHDLRTEAIESNKGVRRWRAYHRCMRKLDQHGRRFMQVVDVAYDRAMAQITAAEQDENKKAEVLSLASTHPEVSMPAALDAVIRQLLIDDKITAQPSSKCLSLPYFGRSS